MRSRRPAPASGRTTGPYRAPLPRGSGSQFESPAGWSSLLFSCTGVNSLVYLAFDWLPESVLADFMERHAIHRDLFHPAVIQLIAFAQKVGAGLRFGDHGNHSV